MTTAEEPGKGPGPPAAAPDEGPAPAHNERIVVRDNRKLKKESGGQPTGAGSEAPAPEPPATPVDEPEPVAPPAASPGGPAEPAAADGGGTTAVDEPEPVVAPGGLGAELTALRTQLDERIRDLQRVSAEYANYRKRVDRDKAVAGEEATSNVFRALLPVFDDLDRAREHGELSEGVAAVVDQLVATGGKFGLTAFGEQGEPFDPTRHEAVAHLTSSEVTEPTCVDVLRRGYLLGDRLLRPAMVAVADPAGPAEATPAEADTGAEAGAGAESEAQSPAAPEPEPGAGSG